MGYKVISEIFVWVYETKLKVKRKTPSKVLFRGDYSIDQFIDIVVGNRIYMPCLYVFNKIDQISLEEVDRIARTPNSGN